jgi:poly-gamma-glutamate capsule biosynthesis protein CapA/YwtB (metallophosphatase superfamily)
VSSRRRILLVSSVLASVIVALGAAQTPRPVGADPDTLAVALSGDSIITRKLSVHAEPLFTRLIDLIRGADAAFTNLEVLFHDYEAAPMHESGGTWMRAEPALAKELAWAGFDMVSRANNHAGDYGPDGMRLTTKYVAEAGLVHAGVGESLAEAREARFLDTPKGRIALISVASTFPDHSRAAPTHGGVRGRPGLSPLRFTTTYQITKTQLDSLRSTARALGLRAPEGDRVRVFGHQFVVGDTVDVRTEPLKEDLDEMAAVVRSASRLSDLTIVSIHAHEGAPGDRSVPAAFLTTFARAMIDAGADLFVGHGPHVVRGVEIYKDKPILYSLGDFIFQNETLLRMPAEGYAQYGLGPGAQVAEFNARRYENDTRGFPADREIWEGVVAVAAWRDRHLLELKLHPITLGFGAAPARRGRPMLAEGELAAKILKDLSDRSKPFGTSLQVAGGVASVALRQPTSE